MPKLPILAAVSPSVQPEEPLSSHHDGGVAAAAFKAIAENPEILKRLSAANSDKPAIKAAPISQRGQVLNVKPKFGGVNAKTKRITTTDVVDVLNTNPSDLFA